MKKAGFFFFFLSLVSIVFAQDTLFLNIREIDATEFARVKIFLNILLPNSGNTSLNS